uniref:Family with sequence similarity 171, member B n=2 Tax=Iconisemion striatum TaxID=60296 RepID=A0A1A7XXR1_9TELE
MHAACWDCLFCALVLIRFWETSGESTGTPALILHADDRNFSDQDRVKQEPSEPQHQSLPGSTFNLQVQVTDRLSGRPLSQALVELFINYTKNNSALSAEDGEALLRAPYCSGLPLTVAASRMGYVSTLMSCKTNRTPIFSSLTVSLLRMSQGNIWLFEDSVLITGKTDGPSQPVVRFPQRLLNLSHSRNVTSLKAYVTVPKQVESLNTPGVQITKSGFVSLELNPVAAVSVQLFSGNTELHVTGPIQISLGVPENRGLRISDAVPAWFFNRTTGGWMRKGLGKLILVDGKLTWAFTAPHLGDWIAAPLSSSRGSLGLPTLVDLISHHLFFLMVFLGGTLLIVLCLLTWLLCHCRKQSGKNQALKTPAVMKTDQTTSTFHDGVCGAPSGNQNQSATKREENQTGDVIVNAGAVAVSLDMKEVTSEQTEPVSLADCLFFYNQPVTILHLEEESVQTNWSRSATLPRVGTSNGAAAEVQRKENFTQTFLKTPSTIQSQVIDAQNQPGGSNGSQTGNGTSRVPFSLPESASVPGTLNKMRGNRHSVHTFSGLSEMQKSPQPPRAWFVSLEGKPAAEIRYAVSEQQRRRRPIESRDTSLDSGVDMSELNQTSSRRTITLERNATFIKNTASDKNANQQ